MERSTTHIHAHGNAIMDISMNIDWVFAYPTPRLNAIAANTKFWALISRTQSAGNAQIVRDFS
jgi:hypothetical protein